MKGSLIMTVLVILDSVTSNHTGTNDDSRAIHSMTTLWDRGNVYFQIDEDIGDGLSVLLQAMKHIEEQTCIRFIENRLNRTDYVNMRTNRCRCYADFIGKKGGTQSLELGSNCTMWDTLHEMLHILGFNHEFQRPDRDMYVTINSSNLQDAVINNSKVHVGGIQKIHFGSWIKLGECYDFQSVMNWPPNFGTKSEDFPNMVPVADINQISNEGELSMWDIVRLNYLYNCTGCTLCDVY